MFGATYFAPPYFGPPYFGGEGGDIIVVPPPAPAAELGSGVILYNDRIASAILSGSTTPSTLTLDRLQDPQPTNVARILASSGFIIGDFGSAVAIGASVFHGTSLGVTATVRLRLSSADPTGVAGDIYDSGVVLAGADQRYRGSFYQVLDEDLSARFVRVDIVDPAASTIDLGIWLAGPVLRPEINFSPPRPLGYVDYGSAIPSAAGITHVMERRRARNTELRFEWADQDEAFGDLSFFDMQRMCGIVQNVAIISDPLSSYRAAELVVGTVTQLIPIQFPAVMDPQPFVCVVNVIERL
jgi:hypothetical protein